MTLGRPAQMMGRGFNEVGEKFRSLEIDVSLIKDEMRDVKQRLDKLEEKINDLATIP